MSTTMPMRALFAFAVCIALAGSGETVDPRERTLDSVQVRYDEIRDVVASFEQTSLVASLGKTQVSRGRLVMARPGRMRWEYTEPEPSVIVVDGEALRMYDPREGKLQILPLAEGSLSPTALGFLLGEAKLRDTFRLRDAPGATSKDTSSSGDVGAGGGADEAVADDGVELFLEPRADTTFESLALRFDPTTHRLRESRITDLFGNRTRVRFSDMVENAGVEEDAFTIQVPDDTDVIDLR